MRVLVDTHTFIWALLHDHRLTAKAKRTLVNSEHELFFSLVSLWEIAIKIRTGKLRAIGSSVDYVRERMDEYDLKLLPIRYEHILQLEALPSHHGDPFDRLLIAQAIMESLPILTHDEQFRSYPVQTLW